FLWVDPIGGWDVQMLIGQKMRVWGKQGPVPGVIARKAIHLLTPDERKQVPEVKDLWIDIGVCNREEALERVSIGDAVTLELGMTRFPNDLAAAAGMDNKVGAWVVMSALQRIAAGKPQAGVYSVST